MPICHVNAQVTTLTSSIQSKGFNGARSWRRLVDAYVIFDSHLTMLIQRIIIECYMSVPLKYNSTAAAYQLITPGMSLFHPVLRLHVCRWNHRDGGSIGVTFEVDRSPAAYEATTADTTPAALGHAM
jgi:hypothetical protein